MKIRRSPLSEPTPVALPSGLRFVRALGESPLSRVLLVEDDEGRPFALKILRASVARDPRLRERWKREARMLQEINHPQLVHGHGTAEVNGSPALLLEFIDGPTLRARLQEQPLEWEQACRYGVQIARALERLHRAGAIHRDVKPHNILLHPQRGAVLADLGLVRREEDTTLTRQGAALGSPAYMSPEQARDPSAVDEQADIYSLGATLHHALSGSPPFQGKGVGEVIHRVMHEAPLPLPEEVPVALAKVVETAMAKDVERRYARVRDFGYDLGRVLLGHAPRLMTRNRHRRRRQRLLAGVFVPLLVAMVVWQKPWQWWSSAAPQDFQESALVQVENVDDGQGQSPTAPSGNGATEPRTDAGAAFLRWSRSQRQGFDQALADGGLGYALDLLGQLEGAEIPTNAPVGFLQERRSYLANSRVQVDVAAERIAGQAMDLLDQRVRMAREAMVRGNFQVELWAQDVEDLWQRTGLMVGDLPLRPGAADPRGRLRLASANLEAEAEAANLQLALDRVPQLLLAGQRLLRTGRFAEARQRWDGLEPKALLQSTEARAEVVRIDELLALDRRLEGRLRENVGQPLDLTLADGSILTGTLVSDQGAYALDYNGQVRYPVNLMNLEAAEVVKWLGSEGEDWLIAQLLWCQGDLNQAVARMRAVSSATTPEEWQPRLWIWLWQQEVDQAASGQAPQSGSTGESSGRAESEVVPIAPQTPAAGPVEAVAPLDPRDGLERAILRLHPHALFTRLTDGNLEVKLENVAIDKVWELDLRQEIRQADLLQWSLHWDIPAKVAPPKRVHWLHDITMTHPGGRLLPSLRVAGRRSEGFGIQPGGGLQVLGWDGHEVSLDGLMVAPWQPDSAWRGRFVLTSSSPFNLTEIRLRLRPH